MRLMFARCSTLRQVCPFKTIAASSYQSANPASCQKPILKASLYSTTVICHIRPSRSPLPQNENELDQERNIAASVEAHEPDENGSNLRPVTSLSIKIGLNQLSPRGENTRPRPSALNLNPRWLDIESDIGHLRDSGSKLVDKLSHSNDFSLWRELLLYRQRHYGDIGTIEIWKGLTRRCTSFELPTEGKDADFLWESFVRVGLQQDWLLMEVQSHAKSIWTRCGKRWKPLYQRIVGHFLETGNSTLALVWHQKLKDANLDDPTSILSLLEKAISTKDGLEIFRDICQATDDHRIYSPVITTLWDHSRYDDALTMHTFLLGRGDIPQSIEDVKPLLNYVKNFRTESQRLAFSRQLVDAGLCQPDTAFEIIRSPLPSLVDSEPAASNSTKPKMMKDQFAARLFATKPFSFDLILSGLKMFEVGAIGPQSLRELALRARDLTELEQQFSALKEAEISLGDSVYSRVVEALVARRDAQTLRELLQSDQHPDVLEDVDTQEALLHHYTVSQDWRLARLTRIILSFVSQEDPFTYNIQLRTALRINDREQITAILHKMKQKRISPSRTTLSWMVKNTLPSHRPGKRPILNKASRESLFRLIGIFQYVINYGGYIPPESWQIALKHLVISNRWSELERLVKWLAGAYFPRFDTQSASSVSASTRNLTKYPAMHLPPSHPQSPLRKIFNADLQKAIISCGFSGVLKADCSKNSIPNPHTPVSGPVILWVRGLILLRELKEKGLHIETGAIQKECRIRLTILFGEGYISKRKSNRRLRETNPWTIERILADMDKAWGLPLFEQFSGDTHRLVNPKQPMRPRDLIHSQPRELAVDH
ncbi:hypothetical protein FQN57_006006 [Myotisia sp. PD_48]|nr:hypothetical protein FQN57_006006 [Myotisia sp. PD_48]